MKYEVALVVGNGFDLNLGLKTSYHNYLESDIFKELLSTCDEVSPIRALDEQFQNNKSKNINWIDLEVFLKQYYRTSISRHRNYDRGDFENLVKNIAKYLETINRPEDGANFKTQSYKLLKSIIDKKMIILNFNYTNFVEQILFELKFPQEKISSSLIYVHGCLENDNIIVGVDESFEQIKETSFLRKASNEKYINYDINEIFENSENIMFFGHSFGETDHSYFDDFFEEAAKKRPGIEKGIIIFYHGSDDWYNKTYELSKLTKNRFKKLMDFNKFTKFDTSRKNNFNSIDDFLVEKESERFKIR